MRLKRTCDVAKLGTSPIRNDKALMQLAKRQSGGGFGSLLLGLVMLALGSYLLSQQVRIVLLPWFVQGFSGYGLALVPGIIGVVLLFLGRSLFGWLMILLGLVVVMAGTVSHIHFFFRMPSLFTLGIILVLFFGGVGLLLRVMQPSRLRR